MGRLCRDNTKTSLAANRTRESRPSGMRGGLAETWAMGELGTHLAIERASVGNSPPKVIRAALLPDGGAYSRVAILLCPYPHVVGSAYAIRLHHCGCRFGRGSARLALVGRSCCVGPPYGSWRGLSYRRHSPRDPERKSLSVVCRR